VNALIAAFTISRVSYHPLLMICVESSSSCGLFVTGHIAR